MEGPHCSPRLQRRIRHWILWFEHDGDRVLENVLEYWLVIVTQPQFLNFFGVAQEQDEEPGQEIAD